MPTGNGDESGSTNKTDTGGTTSWKAQTSAFDRVRSVALTLSEPRSATWIANEALVAENTARRHLNRLAELHVLRTDTTGSAVTYYPDPVYLRTRDLHELIREYDEAELTAVATDLKADIESWQTEYAVDEPAELRSTVAGEGVSRTDAIERRRIASDWELTEYQLSLIEEALLRYDEYSNSRAAPA